MRAVIKGVVTVALLAGTSLAATAPAQARYHHGDNGGAAIVAGIVGLGVGAAIASDHRGSGGYYDNGYAPAYYAEQPVYYNGGYGGGYGYGYSQPYYSGGYDRGYYRGDRGHWDHRGGRDYDRHDRDRGHDGRDRDDRR